LIFSEKEICFRNTGKITVKRIAALSMKQKKSGVLKKKVPVKKSGRTLLNNG
jgi:hypothetical protein